jgi:hypothetical protein
VHSTGCRLWEVACWLAVCLRGGGERRRHSRHSTECGLVVAGACSAACLHARPHSLLAGRRLSSPLVLLPPAARPQANGEWSLFCPNEAPGLADCWGEEFVALYSKYEAEGRSRKVIKAQQLWFAILEAQVGG